MNQVTIDLDDRLIVIPGTLGVDKQKLIIIMKCLWISTRTIWGESSTMCSWFGRPWRQRLPRPTSVAVDFPTNSHEKTSHKLNWINVFTKIHMTVNFIRSCTVTAVTWYYDVWLLLLLKCTWENCPYMMLLFHVNIWWGPVDRNRTSSNGVYQKTGCAVWWKKKF